MPVAIPFTKMVGTGNDFIVVDTLRHRLTPLTTRWRAVSRTLCDRRAGVGADGLLVLEPSRIAAVRMRVFNPDGSEAGFCGNGARCVAVYLTGGSTGQAADRVAERPVAIQAKTGLLAAVVRGDQVSLQMPDPVAFRLDLPVDIGEHRFRVGFVNTGVPHAVVPVDALDEVDVDRTGWALRHHRHFAPRGANVDFVQVDARRPNRLRVRTYERGVEAETLACGSGIVASAIVHALSGGERLGLLRARGNGPARPCRIDVEARSGDVLTVSFSVVPEGRAPRVTDVVLEGAARRVFAGTVHWPLRRGAWT